MNQTQVAAPEAPAGKKRLVPARRNLLIVDDEESIRNLLKRILEKEGYHCIPAADAEEASIFLSENIVDLVISDINMPGRSGIQLLEEIRREYPTIGTIIITGNGQELAENLMSLYPDMKRLFMSGYTADIIASQGVLDGGVHFIQKPFAKHDLAVKVRKALDH
jgi:DNA-binding NtrC family response regulator